MTKRARRSTKWKNRLAKAVQVVEGYNMVSEQGVRDYATLQVIDKGLRESIDKLYTPETAGALDHLLARAERCITIALEMAYDASIVAAGDAASRAGPSLSDMPPRGHA